MQIEKRGKLIFSIIILVLVVSFVSAGIGDWFKTGRASDAPQNVSVTIQGQYSPIVNFVEDVNGGATVMGTEYGTIAVFFSSHVYDQDGVGNIDTSSVNAEFTKGITTLTGPCSYQGIIDGNTANFSCSITMWYYHEDEDWNVNVSARDQENNYADNTSETFTYGEIKTFKVPITPTSLTWDPLPPGSSNQNASNDPTVINNTGNYDRNIIITAYDLVGVSDGSYNISATEFTVSNTDGTECSGNGLGPDGQDNDTSIYANPGQPGSNLAYVYYCIPSVPNIPSQAYTTAARGEQWYIRYI